MIVITKQNDVLDQVCYRYQINTDHIEKIFNDNPVLAQYGSHLPRGLKIKIDDRVITDPAPKTKSIKNLWD